MSCKDFILGFCYIFLVVIFLPFCRHCVSLLMLFIFAWPLHFLIIILFCHNACVVSHIVMKCVTKIRSPECVQLPELFLMSIYISSLYSDCSLLSNNKALTSAFVSCVLHFRGLFSQFS